MSEEDTNESPAAAFGVVITAIASATHPDGAVVPDVSEEDE